MLVKDTVAASGEDTGYFTCNDGVAGSSPAEMFASCSSMAEHANLLYRLFPYIFKMRGVDKGYSMPRAGSLVQIQPRCLHLVAQMVRARKSPLSFVPAEF